MQPADLRLERSTLTGIATSCDPRKTFSTLSVTCRTKFFKLTLFAVCRWVTAYCARRSWRCSPFFGVTRLESGQSFDRPENKTDRVCHRQAKGHLEQTPPGRSRAEGENMRCCS